MAFGSKNDRKKMLASIMDEADGEAILGQIDEEIQSADNRSVGLGSKAAEDSLSDTYENISSMKRSLGERKQSDAKASAAMQKQNGKPSIARDWLTYMFGQEEADAPEVAAIKESRKQSSPVVSIGPASDRSSLTDRAKKDERLARAVAAIKANREKPVSERDRIYLNTGELIPDDMPITYSGDQDAGASGLSQDPDSIRTDEERIEDTQFLSGSGVSIDDRLDDEDETTTTATTGLMSRPKARPNTIQPETKDFEIPEYKVFDKPSDMSELEILARTIEAEASGEKYAGKIAVGATIANRAASGNFGSGIQGVILKRGQFSPWNKFTGYAKGEQGKDMLAFKASEDSYRAANAILTGNYTDETGGATHYVNESVSTPNWLGDMKGRKRGTVTIGNHLFGNADNNKTFNGRTWSIQRIIGTPADGEFGPNSRKKALTFLKAKGLDVTKDTSDEDLMQLIVAS